MNPQTQLNIIQKSFCGPRKGRRNEDFLVINAYKLFEENKRYLEENGYSLSPFNVGEGGTPILSWMITKK